MDISLIIPAYNESEIIKYTIESAKKFLQDILSNLKL